MHEEQGESVAIFYTQIDHKIQTHTQFDFWSVKIKRIFFFYSFVSFLKDKYHSCYLSTTK